jgi:flavin reductase (DIM6/NTAB) family NADH-FMN oxidoreductase RutF
MSVDESPPREFELTLSGGFAPGALDGHGDPALAGIPSDEPIDIGDLEGDPAIAFRRTLGMFATGVTVLTTRVGDQVHGMTANAFMSVSLHPPLVLISVDREARMCGMLREGSRYGVSVLAQDQANFSETYARSARDGPEPRFVVALETPLVEGALAHIVARVVRTYWGGDHSLFLGHVEYARYGEGEPLLFHGGRYERLLGEPELFSRLPRTLLDQLLRLGSEVSFTAGQTLMREGESLDTLMLVTAGEVRVERSRRPGEAMTLGPGALIGEIEVLDPGAGRMATITAETDTTCVVVTRAELHEGLAADPRAAIALLGVLASRFRVVVAGER